MLIAMEEAPYREWPASAPLQHCVRCVWVYAPASCDTAPQRIPPDGCPEFVIHLGAPHERIEAGGAVPHPRLLFAGQITRPLMVRATGPGAVLAVRFQPDGARGFIGRPMNEVTDRQIDMAGVPGVRRLYRDLCALADWDARIEAVQHFVAAVCAGHGYAVDEDVRAAVRQLEHGEAAPARALSTRQMQRRFAAHVGVPAQTLASIFRFRRVFDAIAGDDAPHWISAALSAGYFDQPQMARDFRRFLGCTAREWAAARIGLGPALAGAEVSPSYKTAEERAG
jgi:AraC-like DNA-binding protein